MSTVSHSQSVTPLVSVLDVGIVSVLTPRLANTAPSHRGAARIGHRQDAMQDYYLPGVLAEELLVAADFGDALRVKALIEKGAATPARPAAGRPGAKVSFLRE